jgi:hypothetical protein
MRDCINLLKRNEPIIALVQLTHKDRFEFAGTPTVENAWKYRLPHERLCVDKSIDDYFESVRAEDAGSWPHEIKDYARQVVLTQNEAAINSNLLHWTVGLAAFFKTNNIQYRIFAGPSFKYEQLSDDPFYQYLLADSNVLDLQTFDILTLAGTPGVHPNTEGMQRIANYFINLLGEQE